MDLFILIFFLICLLTVALASLSLAPWVPTRKKDLPRILKLADLQADEIFYDLGCGDGKVVAYLAKNTKAKTIGIELAFPFYLVCKMRQLFYRNKNLKIKFKNLLKKNLSNANVVYLFARSPETLNKGFKQKLEHELKPGARVISYAFPFPGWIPTIVSKPNKNDITIYLYKK